MKEKPHLRMVVEDEEIESIHQEEQAHRFLRAIHDHSFVCFVYDQEGVRLFLRGPDDEIKYLMEVAKDETAHA